MKSVEILVSGRVQKVGFRACIKKIAMNLGITGIVMNLPDGRVRIFATADPIIIDKFVSMLYGCPRAVIRELQIDACDLPHYIDFTISRAPAQERI
ncbi:MAG: acylphosphatase [Methanomicrobiales archaeon]|nr:acylphosphatase [Methanomicrobiales archaeon]